MEWVCGRVAKWIEHRLIIWFECALVSFQSPSAPLSATVCRIFLSCSLLCALVCALCAYADIGCPEGIVVVCGAYMRII
jgi:hypothetical protein